MNKKNVNLLLVGAVIFSITVLFLTYSALPVKAYERPEIKDGLTKEWHPGGFCIPCHYTLLDAGTAKKISSGCKKCHQYVDKNGRNDKIIDMTKIFDLHKDVVCIRCHAGKEPESMTASDFHRIMSKTACLQCHALKNGNYVKPEKTKCSDCHSADPHVVHEKKVEKMCVACHGEFGEKYINLPANEKTSALSSILISEKTSKVPVEYATIGEFINTLIESLLKTIR